MFVAWVQSYLIKVCQFLACISLPPHLHARHVGFCIQRQRRVRFRADGGDGSLRDGGVLHRLVHVGGSPGVTLAVSVMRSRNGVVKRPSVFSVRPEGLPARVERATGGAFPQRTEPAQDGPPLALLGEAGEGHRCEADARHLHEQSPTSNFSWDVCSKEILTCPIQVCLYRNCFIEYSLW